MSELAVGDRVVTRYGVDENVFLPGVDEHIYVITDIYGPFATLVAEDCAFIRPVMELNNLKKAPGGAT